MALLPLTKGFRRSIGVDDSAAIVDGFLELTDDLNQILMRWSDVGPVAYVEAEYFGGVGEQHAQVWDRGTTSFGPLHVDEGEDFPDAGSPISQALRYLGVRVHDDIDEFDAVGLARYRDTDDWPAMTP
jgi:hypothetical protein